MAPTDPSRAYVHNASTVTVIQNNVGTIRPGRFDIQVFFVVFVFEIVHLSNDICCIPPKCVYILVSTV